MTHIASCTSSMKRRNTPFRIRNGEGFYLVEGKEIPVKEFEKKHPIINGLVLKKENPDKRNLWMSAA